MRAHSVDLVVIVVFFRRREASNRPRGTKKVITTIGASHHGVLYTTRPRSLAHTATRLKNTLVSVYTHAFYVRVRRYIYTKS
jgi:hypothetical protein